MKIKKIENNTDKYPKIVTMTNGVVLKIPQQKKFGTYCSNHGCSVTAVSIALQLFGVKVSPYTVYKWCRENLEGYNGSKVAIKGTEVTINGILKKRKIKKGYAKWYPINDNTVEIVRNCIKGGGIVLVESDKPIHTNCLIASRTGGSWNATNGKLKKTTVKKMISGTVKGSKVRSKQNNWFKGRTGDSGVVCVYPE